MKYRYERKRSDRALLGCSMADGGRIIRFARLSPGASVAYDPKRGVEIVSYTEPRGTRFDIEGGKVLRKSSPVKVSFELQRRTDS
jgi:hypothetical protein